MLSLKLYAHTVHVSAQNHCFLVKTPLAVPGDACYHTTIERYYPLYAIHVHVRTYNCTLASLCVVVSVLAFSYSPTPMASYPLLP